MVQSMPNTCVLNHKTKANSSRNIINISRLCKINSTSQQKSLTVDILLLVIERPEYKISGPWVFRRMKSKEEFARRVTDRNPV